ncbi:hypothetical protein HNY73_013908 [Argiope bruennichi]|uniref:Uncharacterized protein n=1 Tax=Argiope bruennichi TaxID=94029 RepID=A0A8T0EML9_ARGBR|nr:hypothetical protein HNY73_013908 [Argiope bruennichi]
MRSSLWLAIFVLVCCVLFVAESKSLGTTTGLTQKKILRFRREIFGFKISDILKAMLKMFFDTLMDSIPIIG